MDDVWGAEKHHPLDPNRTPWKMLVYISYIANKWMKYATPRPTIAPIT